MPVGPHCGPWRRGRRWGRRRHRGRGWREVRRLRRAVRGVRSHARRLTPMLRVERRLAGRLTRLVWDSRSRRSPRLDDWLKRRALTCLDIPRILRRALVVCIRGASRRRAHSRLCCSYRGPADPLVPTRVARRLTEQVVVRHRRYTAHRRLLRRRHVRAVLAGRAVFARRRRRARSTRAKRCSRRRASI